MIQDSTKVAQTVNDVIDHVAAKLSVPVAHLWAILIRQAYVEAVSGGLTILLGIAFGIAAWKLVRFFYAKAKAGNNYDSEGLYAIGTAIGILGTLATVFCVTHGVGSAAQILNPEYFALHEVLGALGK